MVTAVDRCAWPRSSRAPGTLSRSRPRRRRPAVGHAASHDAYCSTPPASCSPGRDYRSTTTREIAEAAGVSEYLLFRHFGSKAGLFREALVLPFTSFVDGFGQTWQAVVPEETDEEELSRLFVGQLYDVLVEHRGLLLTLVASDGLSEDEIEGAGIADIRRALTVLSRISAEGMQIRGLHSDQPDLPAHSTVAMIVGMVAMRSTFFGAKPPSREVIVDELVQAILHGFLHRDN